MGSTRPMWVGLGWTYVMDWVGLNFFGPTMVGWVKIPSTRPMHTPQSTIYCGVLFFIFLLFFIFTSLP